MLGDAIRRIMVGSYYELRLPKLMRKNKVQSKKEPNSTHSTMCLPMPHYIVDWPDQVCVDTLAPTCQAHWRERPEL